MTTIKPRQLILAILLVSCGGIAQAQSATPQPQTIIREMVTRYRTVSSYQDSGVVRVVAADPAIASLQSHSFQMASFADDVLVSFKTYFARPRMFRFDWNGPFVPRSREAVIWSDGKKVYQWMPSSYAGDGNFALYSGDPLQFYIDEALGTSAGAIFPVPSMLIKEASIFSFADLLSIATRVSLLKEEQVDGVTCYVIQVHLSGAPWTLWIDKKDHVLRKTRTLYSRGSFHETLQKGVRNKFFAEEIHRDIRINERIPQTVFKYRPQIQARDVDLTR